MMSPVSRLSIAGMIVINRQIPHSACGVCSILVSMTK